MPLTVGGGIRSVADMQAMLKAGADKTSINSSALADPSLISRGAEKFGSQCVVVSIDAKKTGPDQWSVFSHGGRQATGLDAVQWAKKAVGLGAGEIVLNSIDADGTKAGFDLVITRRVSEAVAIRWWPAAGPAAWNAWPPSCSKARPTPCWPPASSISANSPSAK